MRFLRNLLAAILGTIIGIFLIFMIFVGIAALVGDPDEVEVKKQSVLVLNMFGDVFDYVPKSDNPLDALFGEMDGKYELSDILNAIENAKTDDNIKGISIELQSVDAGYTQMSAIRKKLEDFKKSGKFVYAYSDMYMQKNYYVSSVADSIFINPVGMMDFRGLSTEKLYFKDFQEKYGIKMEVIRHGKYKSAMEGFLDNKMSEANREQTLSYLNSIWKTIVDEIGKSRNKTPEELNSIADYAGTSRVSKAVQHGMIDRSVYLDEYISKLKKSTGTSEDKDLEKITIGDYIKSGKGNIISTASDKIAVIYAQGEIMYGKGDETYVGHEAIIEALRKIAKDKKIKSIVLRINSPGGSALASDLIWREIEIVKKTKPVVVSMGDVAASGGYYIACNANRIFAEPATITGSIGVFGAIPNMTGMAKNIGINAEQVATNKAPDYSVFEPMTNEFHDVIKESIDDIYTTFIAHVAQGRKLSESQVDSLGQGRVWTGTQAKDVGLVDDLGSLDDAIKYAAKISNLKTYKLTEYPRYKTDFRDKIFMQPFGKNKEELIIKEIGLDNYKMYKTLKNFQKMEGIQARMPYELELK